MLHRQAQRGWTAMSSVCKVATGDTLTITSTADAYRPYAVQKSAFLTRMQPVSYAVYAVTAAAKRRKWSYGGNTYWRLRPGYASVAVPGTSNHGWGIALDTCVLRPDGSIASLASSAAWMWLLANASTFGFSWENDESWHLRYFAGDATPAAVTNYEQAGQPAPWPPFNPSVGQWGLYPLDPAKSTLKLGATGDAVSYAQGVILIKGGGGITVNGIFDAQTASRVSNLQAFFKLPVDGTLNKATWGVIDFLAGLV